MNRKRISEQTKILAFWALGLTLVGLYVYAVKTTLFPVDPPHFEFNPYKGRNEVAAR